MRITEELLFTASLQLQPDPFDRAAAVFGDPDDGSVVAQGQKGGECSSALKMLLN